MKTTRLFPSLLVATALALLLLGVARADESTSTLAFSDPTKPGTLKIVVAHGDLHIVGGDSADISVKSQAKAITRKPREDGLRVLTASSSFSLTEKDNVITLDALAGAWTSAPTSFRITVPRATSLIVQSSFGGEITCAGLAGDIEIASVNGEIRLDDLAGGAVVNATHGAIRATIRELRDGKPLSFTSMNGEVTVRVPTDAKANLRLRTQNGSVLTDFDDKALVSKIENSPRPARNWSKSLTGPGGVITPEVQEAIRGAARASANAMRDAAHAVRDAAQAARDGAQASRDAAEASAATAGSPVAPTAPAAPKAPKPATAPKPAAPPMPPMTGGQLVTGTLNGGGPEISVATMNGDVTLRQAGKK
ncbi:MAG: hypothetical protein RLZZ15_2091 [Verrucomicrobiota bacterium]|jgi:DUF4097 and DUF4098 domain-containing protein YvlB